MRRTCICCKTVLSPHWDHDKCSACYRISGEWSEEEFWEHIGELGDKLKGASYKRAPKMFIPPVWY